MTKMFDDSYYMAFFDWAFDPPPIGRPCPDPVRAEMVRFGTLGTSVDVMVGGRSYPVIGITRSGWLSTAGPGWCCFTGDRDTLAAIGRACTPVQSQLMADRKRFNAALHRYAARPDDGLCAGLPETDLGGGRFAIRLAYITMQDVANAFLAVLERLGPDLDGRLIGDLRVRAMPAGFADSTLWWWFARQWDGEGR